MAGNGGETPIIIHDGSLTLESAVPWKDFTGSGHSKVHPHTHKQVRQVSIDVAGQSQTVTVEGKKCAVAVQYGPSAVTVTTGPDGKGLHVETDFASFQDGATPNLLAHKETDHKISHVKVACGNETPVDQNVSGGTRIEISYRPVV
ncbi:MAG: hypothetical protein LAP87_21100 [Acidobacteriia bacterium]|nr:hypothetical protein [Terriglobia bacterium]